MSSLRGAEENRAPASVVHAAWLARPKRRAGSLGSVAFVDATHGWAVESNAVLATSNGGATWRAQDVDSVNLDYVTFPDSTHGWAVGGSSILTYDDTAASSSILGAVPSGVWPVGAAIIALAIVGGLGAALVVHRRRTVSVGVAADRPVPDLNEPTGGLRQTSPAHATAEKPRFCTACGAPVRAGSASCGSCGAKTR
jgi:hypothetical protein